MAYDDKDNVYKMEVSEIFKFDTDFNNIIFEVVKKRKYNYLEVRESGKKKNVKV